MTNSKSEALAEKRKAAGHVETAPAHKKHAVDDNKADAVQKAQDTSATEKDGDAKDAKQHTLEEGHVYFFYRSKVDEEHASSLQDVQRTFMLLKPLDTYHGRKNRLIVIGRKKLPSVDDARPFWAYVEHAAESMEQVTDFLKQSEYDTATRGHRVNRPAKPVGEGVYSIIVDEHGYNTHLAVLMTVPSEPGPVQHALNIPKEGSYVVRVKNPGAASNSASRPATSGGGTGRVEGARVSSGRPDPHYADDLVEKFAGRRFIPVDPPTFLDYGWRGMLDNCEILLVPSRDKNVVEQFDEQGQELLELEQEDHEAVYNSDDGDHQEQPKPDDNNNNNSKEKKQTKLDVSHDDPTLQHVGEKVMEEIGLDAKKFDTSGLAGEWEE
ncbi:hypothetical protein RI367_004269 [Sorochytrium milnesiophthora]